MEHSITESEFTTSANFVTHHIHDFLLNMGVDEKWINLLNLILLLVTSIFIAILLQKIIRYVLVFILNKANKVTRFSIFKYAIKNRLPHFLALIVPYTFIINVVPTVFFDYPKWIKPILKLMDVSMVFIMVWTIMAIIKSLVDLLQEKAAFRNKPMQSYLQVVQIILYICAVVIIFSILTGKSATVFFTAMGAASAVLLLVFKDTIMGFASSIQISANQMVMVGDWITMSKYGADGNVEEINLTTVKVRNFDNTITTIPTYSLISDSFQNWRGMQEIGGRRIKRSLFIKQSDIKILSDAVLDKFEKTEPLKEFIQERRKTDSELNIKLKLGIGDVLKGKRLTNCDLFIEYATWFLQNDPNIRQDMTVLCRQLAPTVTGLPIEIYAFTDATALVQYERVMGEIFNHLIPLVGEFGLTIYESSAGTDKYNVVMNPPA